MLKAFKRTNAFRLWWKRINHIWSYTEFTQLSTKKNTTALCAISLALASIHYNVTEWSMARTGSQLQQLIHADRFLRGTQWSLTVSYSISHLLSVFYKTRFSLKRSTAVKMKHAAFQHLMQILTLACLMRSTHVCLYVRLPCFWAFFLSPVHKRRAFIMH